MIVVSGLAVLGAQILNWTKLRCYDDDDADGADGGAGLGLSLSSLSHQLDAISGVCLDFPIGKNSKDSSRTGRAFLRCESDSVSSASTNH